MITTFSRAIMQRIRFRNKFVKKPSDHKKLMYNKQRNYCFFSEKREKNDFAKLMKKTISHNRKSWHTVKPLSDSVKSKEAIILVNYESVESNEKELSKTLNDFSQILY